MPPQHKSNLNIDFESLQRELEDNNKFFDDLVDMIPASLYIAGNTGDEMYNQKYCKGQHKESKESRKARNKMSKLAKFNPEISETTREAKLRIEQEQYEDDQEESNDDDSNDVEMIQDQHEEEEQENDFSGLGDVNDDDDAANHKSTKKSTSEEVLEDKSKSESQSRIEALRAKLRAKLEAKRLASAPNNTTTTNGINNSNSVMISKRAARRAEKQRRIDEAKKNSPKSASTTTSTSVTSTNFTIKKEETNKIQSKNSNTSVNPSHQDDLMGIDFGTLTGLKMDYTTATTMNMSSAIYKNMNKSLKNMGKKKSLERLLAEVEAKRDRLNTLKASDNTEDKEKAKKIEWGDTLKVASGEKLNNDPSLIKKALKRKAKKKAKSKEAWKSRMDQVKDKMDERLKIRNHNLNQRKLGGAAGANLSKKRIKDESEENNHVGGGEGIKKKRPRLGPHSGKARAGFEGKKQDFINKGRGEKGKDVKSQQ